jgi:hypothetical protein
MGAVKTAPTWNKIMDKKEIYEHLARIYLDASTKKKNPATKDKPALLKASVFVLIFFLAGITFAALPRLFEKRLYNCETALVLLDSPAKINFHFDPAKKETYTMDLNGLNLGRFKTLSFNAKKTDFKSIVSLRVEFNNNFNEKAEVYIKDIAHRWTEFKFDLSKFKLISDWTEMRKLIFTVEEWNANAKKGVVYVDNVRLIK